MIAPKARADASASSVSPPATRFRNGEKSCRSCERGLVRHAQEILQQRVAVLRGDAFGMELHAVHGMGFVHHAHDDAVVASRP